jgi:5-hydroxyisourate hydrolase-like protein (transthyretin family)/archaellum component FlaF (FlaF/FlaG flagellin family)
MATQSPGTIRIDRRWINTALFVLIILAVVAGFAALWWVATLPQRVDEQQTIVVGQTRFAPDSEGSVRVVVQDFGRGKPIAGASVKVSLKPAQGQAISLYEGETDATGSVPVSFHVPADAPSEATLVVETRSSAGRDVVEQPVTVEREYRLLLTSDKPLYQPGQVIHMRALALSTFDLTPARGATINFLVEDPRGNKVFRQSVTASDFGIAAADFTLADLVNQGNYKLSVSIGDTTSEKTVEVRPYVLPKFGVNVSTDRSFYLPGQRVEGIVQADYFFGKPVADSEVRVVGSVWDVERTVVVDLQGRTDENGTYEFSLDLPAYFAGSGLDSGQAQFALEVTVIDQTDHPEQTSTVLPVAAQPLIIEAVAESGVLKPGVENIVYILTSYPDGRPAETQLQVSVDGGEVTELASGEFGLTEFTFTPQANTSPWLRIAARDETGLEASRDVGFETEYGSDSVLLRADRAAYVVGETMNLTALTPVESGSIYLDIVRTGQTLSTRSAQVESGKAEFAVDVSPDMYGTLELHAYKVLLDGTIVRDTRVVVVDAPNDVDIAIAADKDTYLPGETATVDFQTTGEGGGVQTALGVAIVDESVFALQRQDAGFAKLYFMLEQELMEPFYQVKGFELPAAIPPDEEEVRLAQDDAAKAAVAKATWTGVSAAAAQPINSRPEKLSAVGEAQSVGFSRISQGAAVGMILIPLGLWAVAIVALVRSGVVKRALVRLAIAFGIVVVGSFLLSGWFFALANEFYYLDFELLLIPLFLIFIAGMLGFGIYAWVKHDPPAKYFTLLTLAWPALLFLLFLASDQGGEPSEVLIVIALVALALVPGVYLLFGQTRWAQKQRVVGGIATGLGALLALPVMVVLLAGFLAVGSAPMAMGGVPAPGMANGGWAGEEMDVVREVEKEVMVTQVVAATPAPSEVAGDEQEAVGGEAPRLRQYFPETLYWAPEVVTDEGGFVSLEIPMADSITTWRLTALASSQDGQLGFTTQGVRVFQDFFVDIDLPVALTQGDEISIPVGVFNYLPEAQEVRLEVQEEGWFELLGEKEQTLTIASNDIEVVYFPIRVVDFGRQGFQVTAWGEMMSDAIRREVTVVPDGKEIRATTSDWLREGKEIAIDISADAVPDTPYVEVKIYPGVMAQAVEGLEKILRLPDG